MSSSFAVEVRGSEVMGFAFYRSRHRHLHPDYNCLPFVAAYRITLHESRLPSYRLIRGWPIPVALLRPFTQSDLRSQWLTTAAYDEAVEENNALEGWRRRKLGYALFARLLDVQRFGTADEDVA